MKFQNPILIFLERTDGHTHADELKPIPVCSPLVKVRGIIEPQHVISNNVVCATSRGSDQPAHMRSLIRAFASPLNIL